MDYAQCFHINLRSALRLKEVKWSKYGIYKKNRL